MGFGSNRFYSKENLVVDRIVFIRVRLWLCFDAGVLKTFVAYALDSFLNINTCFLPEKENY